MDVLPVGLRELEILDDRCWTMEQAVHQVVVLLQGKEGVVPRLEVVAVYRRYDEGKEMLMAAAEAAGVRVDGRRWFRPEF